MQDDRQQKEMPIFAEPLMGTILTILSGLSFLLLTMVLPLVGPAAMGGSGSPGATRAGWSNANIITFLGILLLSLALAVMAVLSKLERRKVDGSPLPYFSFGLCVICLCLLVAFLTGVLYI